MNKYLLISKFAFIIILLCLSKSPAIGGENEDYKALVEKGNVAMQHFDYKSAVIYYQKASLIIKKYQKKHLDLFQQMGYAQMKLKEYKNAASSFEKYIRICDHLKYDDKELEKVIKWKSFCEEKIRSESQELNSGSENELTIINLKDINSPGDDLGISWINDEGAFLFSTDFVLGNSYDIRPSGDFNIFRADIKKDNSISGKAEALKINSKDQEIASGVSTGENIMYFTIRELESNESNIYYCELNSEKWSAPRKMNNRINTSYTEEYPCVSADGNTMFFSSDRPGGMGGKDIYYSIKMGDGTWSEARNLGDEINTKGDETTPFIDAGGNLYFSSDGHKGIGKMDVFVSKGLASGEWTSPKNLGKPYNSPENEIFFRISPDGSLRLLSSSRARPDYDIYLVKDENASSKKQKSGKYSEELSVSMQTIQNDLARLEQLLDDIHSMSERMRQGQKENEKEFVLDDHAETEIDEMDAVVEQDIKTVEMLITGSKELVSKNEMGFDLEDENCPVFFTEISGLTFSIQIGAYTAALNINDPYFSGLDKNNINIEKIDGLYKYTIGEFPTIHHARQLKEQLRSGKYPDAFIACYLNDQRVPVDKALRMIISRLRQQSL